MLKLRRIPVDAFGMNVAYINKRCHSYQMQELLGIRRIEIHGGLTPVYASVAIVDDNNLVKPDELGLGAKAYEKIGIPEGASVTIAPAPPPASVDCIRKKINGNILSAGEYRSIIGDIVSNRYTNMEIAAFIVANGSFMTPQEVLSLTEAIAGDENHILWENEEMIVDMHCIGGIPGNRTSLIVAPIIASYGLAMPSTLTRGVTSSSGAADVMEVLAKVDINSKKFKNIVEKTKGCLAWNKSLNLAPADDILLSVERTIGISVPQHIVSSILSNKIASGVTHLVIDIPVGKNAKVKTMQEAMKLRKLFEFVGDMLALEIDATITDGSEPIGKGVGPVLEARDVMKVLRNKEDAPQDLREKALFIAGRILEFDPNLRGGQGYYAAEEILDSGKALEKMSEIILSQGKSSPPVLGQLTRDITASANGVIENINTSRITKIAALAGAPRDKGAGIDLIKKVGDSVEQGETLYRIHSSRPTDFAFANGAAEGDSGYLVTYRS